MNFSSDKDFKELFLNYLKSLGISSISLKNYLSDANYFAAWFLLKVKSWGVMAESTIDCLPYLSSAVAKDYKNFLIENKVPILSTNRRLSTLRHLSRFLVHSQISSSDFAQNLNNVSSNKEFDLEKYLKLFEDHLRREKASSNTIKNYLSDIKHFLIWLQTNNHQPLATNH